MNTEQKVITRFAPSPTGFMHVGGIRTALFAWLWARKNAGTFILRIEDTDKEREVGGSIEHIIESLGWLGITWDQGPDIGGPHASYLQSERLDLYKKYANKLIEKGYAYPDPYTEEEVETFRKQAEENKQAFLYRNHRPETFGAWNGTTPLRFKTPTIERKKWHDVVHGELEAGEEALDDFILIKSDGYPTYNFAHIVDDFEMGVTHIMRGEEFISSTPRFLSLYEALEMTPPVFISLPAVLGPDGKKKLGKRDGAKDVLEYRKDGVLPEAMVNFLALLGWNPGTEQEIFTPEDLIAQFDISRIQKAGAKLNDEKLLWVNKEHIKKLDEATQIKKIREALPQDFIERVSWDEEIFKKIIPLLLERISSFGEVAVLAESGELEYYFKDPAIDKSILVWKTLREDPEGFTKTQEYIKELITTLKKISTWDKENIEKVILSYSEKVGKGNVLWPMRVLLSGKEKSPDPFTLAFILGKDTTIKRLEYILHL